MQTKTPILALALVVTLAGCGGSSDTRFAPACPRVGILSDAADLIRYRPGRGRDLTDQVFEARVVGVAGDCTYGDTNKDLKTTVRVSFDVFRGPAASPAREEEVAVFVAVSNGERILDKKVYPIRVKFPADLGRVRAASPEITLVLPISAELSGAAYSVTAGLQLTPDELAANRARSAR